MDQDYRDDTIAAVSTPPGEGGIGIVRLSGGHAVAVADRVARTRDGAPLSIAADRRMLYGHVIDPDSGRIVDEALITVMRGPHTYTREDVVEISCHGGMVPVRRLLELVLRQGARLAEPGEFTRRAFLNGRLSLDQAEAVLDIIASRTAESLRIAEEQLTGALSTRLGSIRTQLLDTGAYLEAHIDFPEDDIEPASREELVRQLDAIHQDMRALSSTFDEARFFREGYSIAIVGRPNVGKSSLLNALLQKDRAIVTDLPGTTRDLIEDLLNINGLPVRITDTAGIRTPVERIEQEGIRRSLQALAIADLVLCLFDGTGPLTQEDRDLMVQVRGKKVLAVITKADLRQVLTPADIDGVSDICILLSAVTGHGLGALKSAIFEAAAGNWQEVRNGVVVTNVRHRTALDRAAEALARGSGLLSGHEPLELVAIELREALTVIGEITGAVTTDEILDRIFGMFCIGK